jgi:hypothetical protein
MRLLERLRLDPPASAGALSQWFAMAGAATAWGFQHAFGYWVSVGNCNQESTGWGSGAEFWTIAASATAALIAISAGLVAVALFRGTLEAETHGQAPPGRVRFLAIVGMAVTPLFLAIILMSGVGASIVSPCQTS